MCACVFETAEKTNVLVIQLHCKSFKKEVDKQGIMLARIGDIAKR